MTSGVANVRRRLLVFVLVVLTCAAAVSTYVLHVLGKTSGDATLMPPVQTVAVDSLSAIVAANESSGGAASTPQSAAIQGSASGAQDGQLRQAAKKLSVPSSNNAPTGAATLQQGPLLMFRHTAPGDTFGQLGVVHPMAVGEVRSIGALRCDRVHFAGGIGVCLEARRAGLATYHAHVFDDHFAVRHSMPLSGTPSRARVSPDGRLGAFTVFVSGHSYNSPGFSTQTSIINTADGQPVVANLETWEVLRDGAPIRGADFNFWGVTFTPDSRRFFATLSGGGKLYLVEGDVAARRMQVIHEDVECPSLSPDGTRIAFKRRAPMDAAGRRIWRLVVLDLATRSETMLDKELRNVDDQVEWLDNREIIYSMPLDEVQASASTNLWALAADASAPPRLLLPFAFSPAVLR